MARVILSENSNELFAQPAYFNNSKAAFLNANQTPLLSSFWDNLVDGIGDFGSGLINVAVGATNAAGNIVTGAGQGVGAYLQNPQNITQAAGIATTAFTGMPIGFGGSAGSQYTQGQNQNYNNTNPLNQLTQNPLLLIGGAALLYFALKK